MTRTNFDTTDLPGPDDDGHRRVIVILFLAAVAIAVLSAPLHSWALPRSLSF